MPTHIRRMAVMLVLTFGLLASSAAAQKNFDRAMSDGMFMGTESDAGNCVLLVEMCYGNTFVMVSHGEWESYHLTVSVNYSSAQFVPNDFVVAGGSWSLVVIRKDQYVGSLYGEIGSGRLSFGTDRSGVQISKRSQLNLTTNGGFGMFDNPASMRIYGSSDMTTNLHSKETSGMASFSF